jgi:hypothetical protein
MPNRNRWTAFSLAGLVLAAAASLAYAAATEEAAAGMAAATEAEPVRHTKMKLVLDQDGSAERIELTDLHELEIGESRTLTTESGTPVVVTRDEQGFELDLNGKKIRLADHLSADASSGPGSFQKRIVVTSGGEGEDGAANVMILRNKVAAEGGDTGDGHDVVMLRRMPEAGAHGFAFTTGDGELTAIPLPIEATIARLQASAKFQELDEATRATVLEALRDSAPKPGALVAGEPGARTIVLEVQDEDEAAAAN